jgi:biopolymer transport protein TolQ
METQALELAHQVDFSFWALFLRATLTVKVVMLVLILASFWSWSIIFQRHIKYRGARKEAAQFDRSFWSGEPLDLLYKELGSSPKGYSASVFVAGMTEWERSQKSDGQLIAGVQSRVERSMDVAVLRASDDLQSGLTILATIGSIAPFIGLFGTGLGHHECLYRNCSPAKHKPCGCCPGHCRGAVGHGSWPIGCYPRRDLL